MSEFRREALDDTRRPAELSPELAALGKRQAAVAALLRRDREVYPHLLQRFRDEGPSAELSDLALEVAADIAAVLQSLRHRQDLLRALEEHPDFPGPPLFLLDQLMFSYLLMTEGATEDQHEALLTPEALEELLNAKRVTDWLEWVDPAEGAQTTPSP